MVVLAHALVAPVKAASLSQIFWGLWVSDNSSSEVEIVSGPLADVGMQWNESGTQWDLKSGQYHFKVLIENGVATDISEVVNYLRHLPPVCIKALEDVTPQWGLEIRDRLGGGSAGCAGRSGISLAAPGSTMCLLHESGHVLVNVAMETGVTGGKPSKQWAAAMVADDISISGYGDGRWGEDVAEFCRTYAICLVAGSTPRFEDRTAMEELQRLSPQRFALWKAIINEPLGYWPPVAASSNQVVIDTNDNGSVTISLDGSGSTDRDGTITSYIWHEGDNQIASGVTPSVDLAVGVHDIELTVMDNDGVTDICTFIVTVNDASFANDTTLAVSAFTASADTAGCLPEYTLDNDPGTRWSVNGDGHWIQYDLGKSMTVSSVKVAWYSGNTRTYSFDIEVSDDSNTWSQVYSGHSSESTVEQEAYSFDRVVARYVKLIGHGNSMNGWNNITELDIWGVKGDIGVR